ncbi:MAG: tetratricopeptide repeat protein, partial [Myxococcota bacterium]
MTLFERVSRHAAAWLLLLAPPAFGADAEALLRQGRVVEALDVAAQAIAERPDDVRAQELAIDVFLSLGQVERAVTHARSRVTAAPTSADSHYLVGRAEVDLERSRSAYRKALALDPDHARAHMGLGSLDEAAGNLDAARTAYTRATQGDPQLAEAWMGLARTHLAAGRSAEARTAARTGFDRTQSSDLALVLATLDPEEARRVLSEALAASGSSLPLHVALARAGLLEGDARLAEDQAQKALVLDVRSFEARSAFHLARELRRGLVDRATLALVLGATPGDAAARKRLDGAVAKAPKSAMVRYTRAVARQAARDARFVDDLEAALPLDATNDLVAAAVGSARLAQGRAAAAIEPLASAVSARPWDRDLSLGLARALREAGHKGDAVQLLARVASANPQHADSQLLYAQTLLDVGKPVEAYAVARVAMQTTGDPRLVAAFVRIAPLAGRPGEAATVLAPIAE